MSCDKPEATHGDSVTAYDVVFNWHNASMGLMIGLSLGGGMPLVLLLCHLYFRAPLKPGEAYCGMQGMGLLFAIPIAAIIGAVFGAGIGGLVDVQQNAADVRGQRNGE